MGRRHLSLLAALAVAAVLAAPAGAGLRWRELGRGPADLAQLISPVAFVATDRASAKRFSIGLPSTANDSIARVDFAKNAVVAVFGEFGCRDHRIAVSKIARRGVQLAVSMVTKPLAPGTAECQALYPTYRLLVVAKSQLGRPYPTSADVQLAGA